MKNDFSTGDIYKDALDNLSKKRGQADNASRGAFANLGERGSAAYDALESEAYVNKALTDRAFGTAGDRMATIKQRRESNLRNTLGKNERQRRSFEQSVDLAIKNYETRQKADEAITTAQYGAAEAAAHVSQSNFEKQLGLKRQQLELDKQNSEFEHAFKLLSDRKLNEKGFQDITGIKVKKKPRPKPVKLVIECGTEPPEPRAGFEIRSTTDEYGVIQYYQVSTKLIEDAKAKGVSLFMPRSNLELTAAVETGNYIYANGKLKSDTQILLEVYGLDPDQGNYDEAYANLEANKEYIIKRYGEGTFWVASTAARYFTLMPYSSTPESLQGDAMNYLDDLYKNPDKYIEQLGIKGYKEELNSAFAAAEAEFAALEPTLLEYGETPEEGLAVLSALAEKFPQYFDSIESYEVGKVVDGLNLPTWFQVSDEWDGQSLYEAMALSSYMDWQQLNGDLGVDAALPEEGVVFEGAQVYMEQNPTYMESYEISIGVAATIADEYCSPEEIERRKQLTEQGESWDDLPLYQQAYYAELKIENFKPALIEQVQASAKADGHEVTDEQAYEIGVQLLRFQYTDQTEAHEAAVEWAKSEYGDGYENVPITVSILYTTYTASDAIMIQGQTYDDIETSWNASTLLLNNPDNDEMLKQINDKISVATWSIATGNTVSAEAIAEIREYGLDEIADILETRSKYNDFINNGFSWQEAKALTGWSGNNYYELTDGAVEIIRDNYYQAYEAANQKAEQNATQANQDAIAQADPNYTQYVAEGSSLSSNVFDYVDIIYQFAINNSLTSDPDDIITTINVLDELRNADDATIQGIFANTSDYVAELSEDRINSLRYYYTVGVKTGDYTAFNDYWDNIKSDVNEAVYQVTLESMRKWTDEDGPWGELYTAARSVQLSPRAIDAYFETLFSLKKGVDSSSATQINARSVSDYAQIATEDLEGFGKIAADAAISLFQNAPAIALSIAGFPGLGALYSAALAAGQDAAQMNLLGVSPIESVLHATVMGGIEFFMSKIPFDNLAKIATGKLAKALIAKGLNKALTTVLTYTAEVAMQVPLEFSEEFLTSIVSNVADIAIAGENSQYMQLVRYNMQEYGLSYEAAGAAAMQTLWQNALYEGYAGAFAGGVSAVIATPFGLRRALKNSVDTMSNSSDISPQKQDLLKAMDEDMNENSINIEAPAGEGANANIRTEWDAAAALQHEGDTSLQSTTDTETMQTAEGYNAQIDQAVTNSIQNNVKANPEGVQTALTEGMGVLLYLEVRLQSDSGNINYAGFKADATSNAYVDFITKRGSMEAVALVMAGDIRTVMQTQALTVAEKTQLMGVLTEIVGSAELAEAYVGQVVDNTGETANAHVDSEERAGDNGNGKRTNPLYDAKIHTDAGLQRIIKEEGVDVNDFAALLDADRVLTTDEKALVRRILQKIGTPEKGTVMQKVIPQKDIQNILNGKYKTVRKSVAQASHVSMLNTLTEIYYGLRLDFDDESFTFNDKTYGRIRYTVEDESSIDYSIDEPGYLYPYTGRGFLGTDKVIIPEYMQVEAEYLDGSIFEIVDAVTGEVIKTYEFNLDIKQWILKGGK